MFFCCEDTTPQKGKHVLQMFRSPDEQSHIQQGNQVKLKAFIRGDKAIKNSKVINTAGKNDKGVNLNTIMNYIESNKEEFTDFALKKVMKSDYELLVEEYGKTNKLWTDPDFPPQQKSFGVGRNVQKVIWKRAREIINNPCLFGDQINPADILQGRIGDCYFLSAIAGIAQKQQRIKAIFPNLLMNKNGIYMARILHKGILQEVVVDDYFPVSKRNGHIMGAMPSKQNEIWVMILQKCWAKLYGSYDAIDGGLPNEVLHAFTGAPIYQYVTNEESPDQIEQIFHKMMQANNNDHVICCGTNDEVNIQEMGLVRGHAYTIIDVYDKPRRLLKVRNPWGEQEWLGGGSDKDKTFWNKVSSLDKKRLGFTQSNDGIFFMFWEDFLDYFIIINICKINDKANYYYQELVYQNNVPLFTTLITKGGSSTLGLTQENTRGIAVPSPRYSTAIIIVAKKIVNKGSIDYSYVFSFRQRNVCDANQQIQNLQPGQYVVYSLLSGRNQNQQATISCYCQSPVQLIEIPKFDDLEFLHRVFLDHAKKNKQDQQILFRGMDVWICMTIIFDSGFAYTVIHVGAGSKVKVKATFSQQQYQQNYFELLPPYTGKGTFSITCQSGQDTIVLSRIVPQQFAMSASLPIPSIRRVG